MSNKVQVRSAQEQDAEVIAEIGVKAWQTNFRGQLPDDYLNSLSAKNRVEQRRQEIISLKSIENILVAVENSEVVGYCHAGPSRDPDAKQTKGELYAIYVRPAKQNRGIGSSLMLATLKYLKDHNFSKATLWVLESNDKTRSWYEAKGWKLEGSKKSEPRKGFDLKEIRYEINLT